MVRMRIRRAGRARHADELISPEDLPTAPLSAALDA